MTAYGNASANSANVEFPFDLASPAARDLWAMAEAVSTAKTTLDTSVTNVVVDWQGPERDTFDGKATSYTTSSSGVSTQLRHLANEIARAWAAARGQQDRINHARYVEADIADDNALENFGEFFVGETDYGPPPENPPVPQPPNFRPTRDPIRAEYGI